MDADHERRKAEKKAAKAAKREAEVPEEDAAPLTGSKRKHPEVEAEAAEAELDVEETAEERAARKAEKKARKAEKRARKEAEAAADTAAEEAETAAAEEATKDKKEKKEKKDKKEKKEKRDADEDEESGATGGAGARPTSSSSSRSAGEPGVAWPCYRPSPAVLAMSSAAIKAFHAEKSIAVEDPLIRGGAAGGAGKAASEEVDTEASALAWAPITEFAHARHSMGADVMACTAGFKTPSPIQAQAWPVLLSGRDMIGIAATGSGKTLAFMLPAFLHIQAREKAKAAAGGAGAKGRVCKPTVLVLAPTRELALQTAKVAVDGGAGLGIRTVCIFGGMPKHVQRDELLAGGGAHVVVATPGRLQDHMADGVLDLSSASYLVLDEADRMLDMGFEKDIRAIVATLPPPSRATGGVAGVSAAVRQTLMFSATWPPAIQAIASEFLAQPLKVVVGSAELAASHSVTQLVDVLEPAAKDAALLRLLSKYHSSRKNRVLVFALYKKEADRLERMLGQRGWPCGAIHGDLTQDARMRALAAFKDGRVPILVATDVAARGLDIPSVEYVINYTFPLTIEDYVHRIGRTGRGGATGTAHTFFTALDKAHAGSLANVLREAGAEVPESLTKFGTHVKKKEHALYGAHFKGGAEAVGAPAAPVKMKFDD